MEDVGRKDEEGRGDDRPYLRGQQDQRDGIRERGGYRQAGWCHPLLWWVEDVLDLYSNDASDGRGLGVCNSCMNL